MQVANTLHIVTMATMLNLLNPLQGSSRLQSANRPETPNRREIARTSCAHWLAYRLTELADTLEWLVSS